ncbi:hypothetical protein [Haloferax larsenii]|uniref:Uncharacterized protein n=1 Tax=Haloferax larsenii TaxID=302484 RepID=A0A1H7V238_HALLR|nr:hypothetical protein [Haloferax larsenii]SEM03321.1 hypothetical protein SAMN04488691_11616 [Haloferax larsenii]
MRTKTKLAAILVALLVVVTTLRSTGSSSLPGEDEDEAIASSTSA